MLLHEAKAPLAFKPGQFKHHKLAFDSFCNQISLTDWMHLTSIIALDCDGSGSLKVYVCVCVCVCVRAPVCVFFFVDVLRQAALLYVAYVELMQLMSRKQRRA